MLSLFFDQFDRIYIVNLKHRTDRKREMQEQLAELGLSDDPRVQFFEAIKTDTPGPFARIGSHGAFLSHLNILKAQATREETVLILQDDCDFIPHAVMADVRDDWDILYGGYHELNPDDLQNSDIIGAHCMAFRPQTVALLADFLETLYSSMENGNASTGLNETSGTQVAPPIDGAIVWFRRAHPEIRTVFQRVSYQRSSRTDIGKRPLLDRVPLPFVARFVRHILRRYRRLKLEVEASRKGVHHLD